MRGVEADVADAKINRVIIEMLNTDAIGDLIDIGTGTGRMLKLLGPYANPNRAVGIDISPDMLALARSNLHSAGLGKVMVRRANMYGLPYPDGSFDTVTMDHVLYQAEDSPRALREAARILRPEGQLLLIDYSAHENEASEHATVSDEQLQGWCESASLKCSELRHIEGQSFKLVLCIARPLRHRAGAAA